tara:strand:+ start:411 stop:554 length:144 start_codon:yes stop_codon:yes gene_type:complete
MPGYQGVEPMQCRPSSVRLMDLGKSFAAFQQEHPDWLALVFPVATEF